MLSIVSVLSDLGGYACRAPFLVRIGFIAALGVPAIPTILACFGFLDFGTPRWIGSARRARLIIAGCSIWILFVWFGLSSAAVYGCLKHTQETTNGLATD